MFKLELEFDKQSSVWIVKEKHFGIHLSSNSYNKLIATLINQLSDKIKEEIRKRQVWEDD